MNTFRQKWPLSSRWLALLLISSMTAGPTLGPASNIEKPDLTSQFLSPATFFERSPQLGRIESIFQKTEAVLGSGYLSESSKRNLAVLSVKKPEQLFPLLKTFLPEADDANSKWRTALNTLSSFLSGIVGANRISITGSFLIVESKEIIDVFSLKTGKRLKSVERPKNLVGGLKLAQKQINRDKKSEPLYFLIGVTEDHSIFKSYFYEDPEKKPEETDQIIKHTGFAKKKSTVDDVVFSPLGQTMIVWSTKKAKHYMGFSTGNVNAAKTLIHKTEGSRQGISSGGVDFSGKETFYYITENGTVVRNSPGADRRVTPVEIGKIQLFGWQVVDLDVLEDKQTEELNLALLVTDGDEIRLQVFKKKGGAGAPFQLAALRSIGASLGWVSFIDRNRMVIAQDNGTLGIYDVATSSFIQQVFLPMPLSKISKEETAQWLRALAANPESNLLAEKQFKVNYKTSKAPLRVGKSIPLIELNPQQGEQGIQPSVVTSPRGRYLAIFSGVDLNTKVFDRLEQKEIQITGLKDELAHSLDLFNPRIRLMAFSFDETLMASLLHTDHRTQLLLFSRTEEGWEFSRRWQFKEKFSHMAFGRNGASLYLQLRQGHVMTQRSGELFEVPLNKNQYIPRKGYVFDGGYIAHDMPQFAMLTGILPLEHKKDFLLRVHRQKIRDAFYHPLSNKMIIRLKSTKQDESVYLLYDLHSGSRDFVAAIGNNPYFSINDQEQRHKLDINTNHKITPVGYTADGKGFVFIRHLSSKGQLDDLVLWNMEENRIIPLPVPFAEVAKIAFPNVNQMIYLDDVGKLLMWSEAQGWQTVAEGSHPHTYSLRALGGLAFARFNRFSGDAEKRARHNIELMALEKKKTRTAPEFSIGTLPEQTVQSRYLSSSDLNKLLTHPIFNYILKHPVKREINWPELIKMISDGESGRPDLIQPEDAAYLEQLPYSKLFFYAVIRSSSKSLERFLYMLRAAAAEMKAYPDMTAPIHDYIKEEIIDKSAAKKTSASYYRLTFVFGGFLRIYKKHIEPAGLFDLESFFTMVIAAAGLRWGSAEAVTPESLAEWVGEVDYWLNRMTLEEKKLFLSRVGISFLDVIELKTTYSLRRYSYRADRPFFKTPYLPEGKLPGDGSKIFEILKYTSTSGSSTISKKMIQKGLALDQFEEVNKEALTLLNASQMNVESVIKILELVQKMYDLYAQVVLDKNEYDRMSDSTFLVFRRFRTDIISEFKKQYGEKLREDLSLLPVDPKKIANWRINGTSLDEVINRIHQKFRLDSMEVFNRESSISGHVQWESLQARADGSFIPVPSPSFGDLEVTDLRDPDAAPGSRANLPGSAKWLARAVYHNQDLVSYKIRPRHGDKLRLRFTAKQATLEIPLGYHSVFIRYQQAPVEQGGQFTMSFTEGDSSSIRTQVRLKMLKKIFDPVFGEDAVELSGAKLNIDVHKNVNQPPRTVKELQEKVMFAIVVVMSTKDVDLQLNRYHRSCPGCFNCVMTAWVKQYTENGYFPFNHGGGVKVNADTHSGPQDASGHGYSDRYVKAVTPEVVSRLKKDLLEAVRFLGNEQTLPEWEQFGPGQRAADKATELFRDAVALGAAKHMDILHQTEKEIFVPAPDFEQFKIDPLQFLEKNWRSKPFIDWLLWNGEALKQYELPQNGTPLFETDTGLAAEVITIHEGLHGVVIRKMETGRIWGGFFYRGRAGLYVNPSAPSSSRGHTLINSPYELIRILEDLGFSRRSEQDSQIQPLDSAQAQFSPIYMKGGATSRGVASGKVKIIPSHLIGETKLEETKGKLLISDKALPELTPHIKHSAGAFFTVDVVTAHLMSQAREAGVPVLGSPSYEIVEVRDPKPTYQIKIRYKTEGASIPVTTADGKQITFKTYSSEEREYSVKDGDLAIIDTGRRALFFIGRIGNMDEFLKIRLVQGNERPLTALKRYLESNRVASSSFEASPVVRRYVLYEIIYHQKLSPEQKSDIIDDLLERDPVLMAFIQSEIRRARERLKDLIKELNSKMDRYEEVSLLLSVHRLNLRLNHLNLLYKISGEVDAEAQTIKEEIRTFMENVLRRYQALKEAFEKERSELEAKVRHAKATQTAIPYDEVKRLIAKTRFYTANSERYDLGEMLNQIRDTLVRSLQQRHHKWEEEKPLVIPLSHLHEEDAPVVGGKAAQVAGLRRAIHQNQNLVGKVHVPDGFAVSRYGRESILRNNKRYSARMNHALDQAYWKQVIRPQTDDLIKLIFTPEIVHYFTANQTWLPKVPQDILKIKIETGSILIAAENYYENYWRLNQLLLRVYTHIPSEYELQHVREQLAEFRNLYKDRLDKKVMIAIQYWGKVAVRSSGIAEDSETSSMAGEGETELNIFGYNGIKAALFHVLDILGKNETPIEAALIQKMVPSKASAVAYGLDFETDNPDVISFTAIFGQGDLLVSGRIERPYQGLLSKETLEKIGEWEEPVQKIVKGPGFGPITHSWSEDQTMDFTPTHQTVTFSPKKDENNEAKELPVTDQQVKYMAAAHKQMEWQHAYLADTEFAIDAVTGVTYIVQVRAVASHFHPTQGAVFLGKTALFEFVQNAETFFSGKGWGKSVVVPFSKEMVLLIPLPESLESAI